MPSLRPLFRGNQIPPDLKEYPPEYCPGFFAIEEHVVLVGDRSGDRSDQEMEEIYAALRRRPDGRSLGVIHDTLWQVAALILGTRVTSQAEYEAIFGRLESSVRNRAMRPVSRNYATYLQKTIGAPA